MTQNSLEQQQLLQLFELGDREGFTNLVDRYLPNLHKLQNLLVTGEYTDDITDITPDNQVRITNYFQIIGSNGRLHVEECLFLREYLPEKIYLEQLYTKVPSIYSYPKWEGDFSVKGSNSGIIFPDGTVLYIAPTSHYKVYFNLIKIGYYTPSYEYYTIDGNYLADRGLIFFSSGYLTGYSTSDAKNTSPEVGGGTTYLSIQQINSLRELILAGEITGCFSDTISPWVVLHNLYVNYYGMGIKYGALKFLQSLSIGCISIPEILNIESTPDFVLERGVIVRTSLLESYPGLYASTVVYDKPSLDNTIKSISDLHSDYSRHIPRLHPPRYFLQHYITGQAYGVVNYRHKSVGEGVFKYSLNTKPSTVVNGGEGNFIPNPKLLGQLRDQVEVLYRILKTDIQLEVCIKDDKVWVTQLRLLPEVELPRNYYTLGPDKLLEILRYSSKLGYSELRPVTYQCLNSPMQIPDYIDKSRILYYDPSLGELEHELLVKLYSNQYDVVLVRSSGEFSHLLLAGQRMNKLTLYSTEALPKYQEGVYLSYHSKQVTIIPC